MKQRVHIGGIHVDLRGVAPATARAAAQALGPALQRALAESDGGFASATRIDAGRIGAGASTGAGSLAEAVAMRIARQVRGGGGR
jgi:hypothetical protein